MKSKINTKTALYVNRKNKTSKQTQQNRNRVIDTGVQTGVAKEGGQEWFRRLGDNENAQTSIVFADGNAGQRNTVNNYFQMVKRLQLDIMVIILNVLNYWNSITLW